MSSAVLCLTRASTKTSVSHVLRSCAKERLSAAVHSLQIWDRSAVSGSDVYALTKSQTCRWSRNDDHECSASGLTFRHPAIRARASNLPWEHDQAAPIMQELLGSWSLEAYLSTKPPSPVVTLSASTTVGQALKQLASHNVTSAPVFEQGSRTYLGFIDLDDVLQLLLSIVNVRELTEEDRVYKLRAAGLQLEHQPLSALLPGQDGALIYKADLRSSLLDVILHGFLEPAGGNQAVVHRVGVFEEVEEAEEGPNQPTAGHGAAADADMGDGHPGGIPGIRVTHVISQSDILRFVLKRLERVGPGWPLAELPLEALGFTCQPVMCVPQEMSTINALATMASNQVSCVGVVSHSQGGALAAQLSSRVLRGMLPQQFSCLASPVMNFLSSQSAAGGVGASQSSWRQAGGPAQAAGLKGSEPLKPLPVVKCKRTTPFLSAIQQMVAAHAHRVFIVDERQRPVGIMTQTDVLRKMVGWQPGLSRTSLAELQELEDAEQEVEQRMEEEEEGEEEVMPDCGLEPGGELVEGPVGLRGVPSAAAFTGWTAA